MVSGTMSRRNRRIGIGVALALLVAVSVAPNPRADIRILTADKSDANPRQFQAAVEIGRVAISVLITWTARLAH
jgi:hypothetical protein